jgi:hypothetical protein
MKRENLNHVYQSKKDKKICASLDNIPKKDKKICASLDKIPKLLSFVSC